MKKTKVLIEIPESVHRKVKRVSDDRKYKSKDNAKVCDVCVEAIEKGIKQVEV